MTTLDVGLDLGATLTKAVAVGADRPLDGFESFVCAARDEHLLDAFLDRRPTGRIAATGGGAARLARRLAERGRRVALVDEFEAWGAGETALLAEGRLAPAFPHVLVSLGTGTSVLLVSAPGSVARIGGTALGGGTLRGLATLLLGERPFEEVVSLAAQGDRRRVDLLVGDLYGPGEIALVPDLTAANFGKLGSRSAADLANALVGLLGENVALLASELAKRSLARDEARGRPEVVYAGSTLRNNPILVSILRDVTALVGCAALFLPQGEFTGAAGALVASRTEARRRSAEGAP